jgi:hypothetical protein
MKSPRPVFLIATGLIIGAIAGWYAAERQFSKWTTSFAIADTLPNLADAYQALQALRSGDTNEVIETLEMRLDSGIITLRALALEEANAKKHAGYMRALERVRDYRTKHPRKTDSPETDQLVADALASISKMRSK